MKVLREIYVALGISRDNNPHMATLAFTHEVRTRVPKRIGEELIKEAMREGLKPVDIVRKALMERYPDAVADLLKDPETEEAGA